MHSPDHSPLTTDFLMMTTIGTHKDLALRADIGRKLGFRLLVLPMDETSPDEIRTGTIRALAFNGRYSELVQIPSPHVLYDRSRVGISKRDAVRFAFTEKGKLLNEYDFCRQVLSKTGTYDLLKGTVKQPPTKPLLDAAEFLEDIRKYDFLVIKPVSGSSGRGVFSIKQNGNTYSYDKEEVNKDRLVANLQELIAAEPHLYQEGIRSPQIDERAFDIRLIYQRNGEGKLVHTGSYGRVAPRHEVTANLSVRGRVESLQMLETYFGESITEKAQQLAEKALEKIASRFRFGETGVDVMFDEKFEPCLIEVNSKPGFEGPQTLASYVTSARYGNFFYQYSNEEREEWGKVIEDYFTNPFLYSRYLSERQYPSSA
jgi:glutathione synthase/RimK-type ligase-like ATP-grasp enzyme